MNVYKKKWMLNTIIAGLCSLDIAAYANHSSQFLETITDNQSIYLQSILTLDDQFDNLSHIMASGGQLTISGASSSIQFLQALFYSDTGCTTLLGGASAVDNVAGLAFSSGGTVSVNTDSTYKLANNRGITTGNIGCMKLYVDGGNQSSDGVACQTFDDLSCSGTSCTSSQTKAVTWDASPTLCSTHYAYITNAGNDSVTKCDVATVGGALSNCATTGSSVVNPRGIAINNYYAYIASDTNGTVTECDVNVSNGILENCLTPRDVSLVEPRGLTINGGWLYVVSQTLEQVGSCQVSALDGDITTPCSQAGTGFSDPYYVTYNNGYGYVANNGNDTVSLCTASSVDGSLSSCTQTPAGVAINNPRGIAINNGFAYIVRSGGSSLTRCTVDSNTGVLSDCGSTGSGFNQPRGITINNDLAYVVNRDGNSVSLCTINSSTGDLTCSDSGATALNTPFYISFF